MRTACPTAAEIARMSWRARERLVKRLPPHEHERNPLDVADATDLPDTREAARALGEIELIEMHRKYVGGLRNPEVKAGEREYQRRRKATQRARARRAAA